MSTDGPNEDWWLFVVLGIVLAVLGFGALEFLLGRDPPVPASRGIHPFWVAFGIMAVRNTKELWWLWAPAAVLCAFVAFGGVREAFGLEVMTTASGMCLAYAGLSAIVAAFLHKLQTSK